MNKPNTIESVQPLSGRYSLKQDLRLNSWFAVAAGIYFVDLALGHRHPEWSANARAALALAPLIPGLLYVRAGIRFVRGMDELQRRIQLEAWFCAAMGALFFVTAVNVLNNHGIHLGTLRQGLGVGGTFALTFALWVVASLMINRRYK